MYKINEFSKMTGLPATTLRYYESEQILVPSRDSESNYRYYCEADFERANLLRVLRDHQFTIAEIKDILMTISNREELSFYLNEKKQQIINEISKLNALTHDLDVLMSDFEVLEIKQEYQVKTLKIDPQLYIYSNYSGNYNEMGEHVNQLYILAKDKVSAPLFLLDDFENEDVVAQICLPVSSPLYSSTIKSDELLPQYGIQLIHNGTYQTIGNAYKYLIDYAKAKHLKRGEKFITRFIKGSGKLFRGNENSYITEIILLLENKEE